MRALALSTLVLTLTAAPAVALAATQVYDDPHHDVVRCPSAGGSCSVRTTTGPLDIYRVSERVRGSDVIVRVTVMDASRTAFHWPADGASYSNPVQVNLSRRGGGPGVVAVPGPRHQLRQRTYLGHVVGSYRIVASRGQFIATVPRSLLTHGSGRLHVSASTVDDFGDRYDFDVAGYVR